MPSNSTTASESITIKNVHDKNFPVRLDADISLLLYIHTSFHLTRCLWAVSHELFKLKVLGLGLAA